MPHNVNEKILDKKPAKLSTENIVQFYSSIVKASYQDKDQHNLTSMLTMIKKKFTALLTKPSDKYLALILKGQIKNLVKQNFFGTDELRSVANLLTENIHHLETHIPLKEMQDLIEKLHHIDNEACITKPQDLNLIKIASGIGTTKYESGPEIEAQRQFITQDARNRIAQIYPNTHQLMQDKNWDNALQAFNQCVYYLDMIDHSEKTNEEILILWTCHRAISEAHYQIAKALFDQRQYNKAIPAYQRALESLNEIPMPLRDPNHQVGIDNIGRNIARSLTYIAAESSNRGELEDAYHYAEKADHIFKSIKTPSPLNQSYLNSNYKIMSGIIAGQGGEFANKGNEEQAIPFILRAIHIENKIPNESKKLADIVRNIQLHEIMLKLLTVISEKHEQKKDQENLDINLKKQNTLIEKIKELTKEKNYFITLNSTSSSNDKNTEFKETTRQFMGMRPKKEAQIQRLIQTHHLPAPKIKNNKNSELIKHQKLTTQTPSPK